MTSITAEHFVNVVATAFRTRLPGTFSTVLPDQNAFIESLCEAASDYFTPGTEVRAAADFTSLDGGSVISSQCEDDEVHTLNHTTDYDHVSDVATGSSASDFLEQAIYYDLQDAVTGVLCDAADEAVNGDAFNSDITLS